MTPWRYRGTVPGLAWPALPGEQEQHVLALAFQLGHSQWLTPQGIAEAVRPQLEAVLRHAYESAPYYRASFGGPPDAAMLEKLPLLPRRALQQNFAQLFSHSRLAGHGSMTEVRTSGSTGAPVRLLKSALQGIFWRALTLRDHRWHARDLSGALAVIRKGAGRGSLPSWGSALEGVVETGPCVLLDVDASVGEQFEWLQRHNPEYLLTYPSLAAELAGLSMRAGVRLRSLRQVRTLGEALDPETRALCREAWGVPIVDMYSAEEVGYIALQCPEHEHYHVQAENVVVEVLDDAGNACKPGEVGRVVVTDLHNFAMPMIRYEIGDYAEAGGACPCGRGLPVLKRILGRTRNLLVAPDGKRYWSTFGMRSFAEAGLVQQYQFVQKAADLIEARVVTPAPLTGEQEERLRRHILERLPAGLRLELVRCDRIGRGAGGKFEEFICEVSAGAR